MNDSNVVTVCKDDNLIVAVHNTYNKLFLEMQTCDKGIETSRNAD